MPSEDTNDVQDVLASPEIHTRWAGVYRTAESARFYELVFDRVLALAGAQPQDRFLDAGCGWGTHAVRLARRGFRVVGIDFSAAALMIAKQSVAQGGSSPPIPLCRGSLLALPFPTEHFAHVLSWGVLMHVPDVEAAVMELARVVKRGGSLVIGDLNAHSVEARLRRFWAKVARPRDEIMKQTPAGWECWTQQPSGRLLTRQTDIDWLVARLGAERLALEARMPGQLSQAYTKLPTRRLRSAVHRLNEIWFRASMPALAAIGNVLVFRKR